MMSSFDIYSFFNSPDVAEHCKNISHTFNAFESAVMINQCNTKTLEEKLTAYRIIINEYPDMEVPPGLNRKEHIPSFHETLGQIIEHEEQKLKKFLECEPLAVYRVNVKHKDRGRGHYPSEVFSSCEKAVAHAATYLYDAKRAGECEGEDYISGYVRLQVNKFYIDSKNHDMATLTISGETIEVLRFGPPYEDEPTQILDCYINIPVPFKKGDLVECDEGGGYMGNIFVLRGLSCDSPNHEKWVMYNDTTDMTADVYYLVDDQVNCEAMHFYPNLRYCQRELEGDERILKYVSLFVQDGICLCELLVAQKLLLADKVRTEQIDSLPGNTISPDIHGLVENIKKG